MIAGQDAQTAGIEREAFRKTVFGREVGNLEISWAILVEFISPRSAHVPLERLVQPVHLGEKPFIMEDVVDLLLLEHAYEVDGVVVGRFPEFGVDAVEQQNGFLVPAEPDVHADPAQSFETGRESRGDAEGSDGSVHGATPGGCLGGI